MDYFNLLPQVDLRRNPDRKTYQIKSMWEHHHEIVRLALLGMRPVEISRKLGFTKEMVSYTLNSPIVKEKLSIMRAARDSESVDIARDIMELAPKAVEVYKKLLDEGTNGDSKATALHKATADRVLEIAGHGPVKRIQADHRHAHAHFTPDELEEVKARGRKAAKESGEMIVDAEYEES